MKPLILSHAGKTPRVAPDAYIAPGVILIGDVEIGPEANIWFGCILRADTNFIRIGARTNIQDGTVIHVNGTPEGLPPDTPGWGVTIGADVTVGHMVLIHACTLEDRSFVGMRASVIDGAVVESGAMVAAGALITPNKRVKKGELWAGSPARPMRALTDKDYAEFEEVVHHYVERARLFKAGG